MQGLLQPALRFGLRIRVLPISIDLGNPSVVHDGEAVADTIVFQESVNVILGQKLWTSGLKLGPKHVGMKV